METERKQSWIRVDKKELAAMSDDFKRYRTMFRILFTYLILDILIHFDILT